MSRIISDESSNRDETTRTRTSTRNMFSAVDDEGDQKDRDDPRVLSDQCLRELMGKVRRRVIVNWVGWHTVGFVRMSPSCAGARSEASGSAP